jgi:putative RecB family exonuclease
MSCYAECPKKWHYRYVVKIPQEPKHFFSFGKSMHSACEFFHGSGERAPSLEDTIDFYRRSWLSEGYQSDEQELDYYKQGLDILEQYVRVNSDGFKPPLFVEFEFNTEIEGVPIRGFVDRIDEHKDGRISIVDYKTGRKIPWSRLANDKQLTMYQMACEHVLGREVQSLSLYHLPSLSDMRVGRREKPLVDELKQQLIDVSEAIKDEKFDPTPSDPACRWCDYRNICPVFNKQ